MALQKRIRHPKAHFGLPQIILFVYKWDVLAGNIRTCLETIELMKSVSTTNPLLATMADTSPTRKEIARLASDWILRLRALSIDLDYQRNTYPTHTKQDMEIQVIRQEIGKLIEDIQSLKDRATQYPLFSDEKPKLG